jgi:hypothetical protein
MGPALTSEAPTGTELGLPIGPRLLGEPAAAAKAPAAAALARRCRPEVRFLHDRSTPGRDAAIDHIAIAPGGVWVIAAPRRLLEAHARIGALEREVGLVSGVVEEIAPDVRTFGALCLPDAVLPSRRPHIARGVPVCGAEALATLLNADGSVDETWVALLAEELALAFPAI